MGRAAVYRDELTKRERDILQCLADGKPTPEIASALELTLRTVEDYIQKVREKLGAKTRREAITIATQRGLVGPSRKGEEET